jgi:hypothetical protein
VGSSVCAELSGTILATNEIVGTDYPVDGAFTIAFLVAAAAGLIAGEILNEWRRERPRARRGWRRS